MTYHPLLNTYEALVSHLYTNKALTKLSTAIIREIRSIKYVQFLPKEELPVELPARLSVLFTEQQQWTYDELLPSVRDCFRDPADETKVRWKERLESMA